MPTRVLSSARAFPVLPLAIAALLWRGVGARQFPGVETLSPVAALPAHVAGSFEDLAACQQSASGEYFVFDRRAHAVYIAPPGLDAARKLIQIGAERGRVLDPTAFDLAPDASFVVADAPRNQPRVQLFVRSGSTLGGFLLQGRAVPRITLGNLVLNGIGSIEYTGESILLSQPEHGALITEYSLAGQPRRSFGELRRTGHEAEPNVHLALNTGIVVAVRDGYYFVFLAGVPQFRRYDLDGRLVYERHIEGTEVDRLVQTLPTTWTRQKTEDGEIPVVLPSIHAAAADAQARLWVATAAGVTYVYDAAGDKRRTVQFKAAGPLAPRAMSFTPKGRLLVAPGCYEFAV